MIALVLIRYSLSFVHKIGATLDQLNTELKATWPPAFLLLLWHMPPPHAANSELFVKISPTRCKNISRIINIIYVASILANALMFYPWALSVPRSSQFPRASLSENCSLLRTDVREHPFIFSRQMEAIVCLSL